MTGFSQTRSKVLHEVTAGHANGCQFSMAVSSSWALPDFEVYSSIVIDTW